MPSHNRSCERSLAKHSKTSAMPRIKAIGKAFPQLQSDCPINWFSFLCFCKCSQWQTGYLVCAIGTPSRQKGKHAKQWSCMQLGGRYLGSRCRLCSHAAHEQKRTCTVELRAFPFHGRNVSAWSYKRQASRLSWSHICFLHHGWCPYSPLMIFCADAGCLLRRGKLLWAIELFNGCLR